MKFQSFCLKIRYFSRFNPLLSRPFPCGLKNKSINASLQLYEDNFLKTDLCNFALYDNSCNNGRDACPAFRDKYHNSISLMSFSGLISLRVDFAILPNPCKNVTQLSI